MIETNFKNRRTKFRKKTATGLSRQSFRDSTTLKVLMLGYMNREALEKSLAEEKGNLFQPH